MCAGIMKSHNEKHPKMYESPDKRGTLFEGICEWSSYKYRIITLFVNEDVDLKATCMYSTVSFVILTSLPGAPSKPMCQ